MVAKEYSPEETFFAVEPFDKNDVTKKHTKRSEKSKRDFFFLYFAAFTGSMCFFGSGICLVWTSPVIPKLLSNNTEINPLGYPVSSYEISLMMALFSIGNVVILLIGGSLIDAIGRKNTLLIMSVINGVSLIALSFATDIIWILIARIINGICLGGFGIALPIFISEITDDHNRGKFGCIMGLFTPLGQLYCYTMGFFCSYRLFSLTCAIPILLSTIPFLLFVPETPIHLLHKNNRNGAVKSLEKYRCELSLTEIEKEMQLMQFTIEQTTKDHDGTWKSLFSHQPTRRGFIIGLCMFMIQNGSGIMILMSFMGPIFEEARVGISGNMTAILVGILKITTFFFVASIVENLGRKSLMFVSAILCSTALFFLGTYFYMKERHFSSEQNYSWIPLASILFFIFAYAIGLGPVPIATIGELFAINVRATAFSVIILLGTIFNAILASSYPLLVTYIGISGCMWTYSANCLLGAIFVYFVMPETKGKSVQEIQEMLKEKRNC